MGSCLQGSEAPEAERQLTGSALLIPSDDVSKLFSSDHLLYDLEKPESALILDEVLPLQRIIYILKRYLLISTQNEDADNVSIHEVISESVGSWYNTIHFVNDYHFLLFHYAAELETVSHYVLERIPSVNPLDLTIFHRNYRNRDLRKNQKSVYDLFDAANAREVATVQLMDSIYCYLVHTLPMGLRLKSSDYIDDEDDDGNASDEEKDDVLFHALRDDKMFAMNQTVTSRCDDCPELNCC